jgi:hypothetical protein
VTPPRHLGLALLPALLCLLRVEVAESAQPDSVCERGAVNPVIVENCRSDPGTWSSEWRADRGRFLYDTRILAGYASSQSVNVGGTIHFYVRAPQSGFDIQFYRLGWYGGAGGRRVASVRVASSPPQPQCHWQEAGTVGAYFTCNNWRVSYSLSVPSAWTAGIYLASIRSLAPPPGTKLNAYAHDVVFVVRDDTRRADFIYQQPVATEEAYNSYAYGPGLYDVQAVNGHLVPVAKASFERPFDALDNLQFYRFELPFIFWLESQGYDTVYTTDLDTHRRTTPLSAQYKAFIVSGHPEYWSRPMYDAITRARDDGAHLGIFGGNAIYWQMRLEDETAKPGDETHTSSERVMVVFRHPYPPDDNGLGDPDPDPTLQTIYWRDFPVLRDEEAVVGVHFTHPLYCTEHVAGWAAPGVVAPDGTQTPPVLRVVPQPLVVSDAASWAYDGTGLRAGDSIAHVYGQEVDAFEPSAALPPCGRSNADPPSRPPSYRSGTFTILASSPFTHVVYRGSQTIRQPTVAPVNSVLYQACSGAWVFGAGDIMWGNTLAPSLLLSQDYSSAQLQQLSHNILDVFAGRKAVASGGKCVPSLATQLTGAAFDILFDD